ncbi:MAG: hypothetical protein A2Z49_09160 [Chloroflexi bacterium RBG_19FT_COMBO_56_12]|nr:MAG: hypothetical protein A2Z49_09160 [Chloroflexi bacterium RBG_19FT_COMBO_56_12]
MKTVIISNLTQSQVRPIQAGYCASFLCQLRGLMFRESIPAGEGLLLVQKKDDKLSATIHMMFMRFDICAVWMNKACEVVDVRYARRWGLAFAPRTAACYVLELNAARINDFCIGDKVHIDESVSTN